MSGYMGELFDRGSFDAMVDAGYVRVQHHPDLPLHIANYSEKAQYENCWNPVTTHCRGLIFGDDWRIIARPYRKFFNYGDETNTGPLDLEAPVHVSDKLDGSLGISYPTPQGTAVATRGSFTSDQALHASELLASKYADWRPAEGWTYLWEIVYPQNRIVVDYGQLDDLILHGAVHIGTGRIVPPYTLDWPGPKAQQFPHATLAEALAAEPRPNAEGMVVRYTDSGRMVKIKQADYVALHRIVTGLNAKTVWEWLGDGKTVGDLCATVPDDFHSWIEDVAEELREGAGEIIDAALANHARILTELTEGWSRREYAFLASQTAHLRPYLFLLLDGNADKAGELAWRAVKPSGARSLVNHSEAVA